MVSIAIVDCFFAETRSGVIDVATGAPLTLLPPPFPYLCALGFFHGFSLGAKFFSVSSSCAWLGGPRLERVVKLKVYPEYLKAIDILCEEYRVARSTLLSSIIEALAYNIEILEEILERSQVNAMFGPATRAVIRVTAIELFDTLWSLYRGRIALVHPKSEGGSGEAEG